MTTITVVIPVGPYEPNRRWLSECLASVAAQTVRPEETLLVDDMAGIVDGDLAPLWAAYKPVTKRHDAHGVIHADRVVDDTYQAGVRVWRAPWRLGVAGAFNVGVGLATGDLIVLLGSDDTLEPTAVEKAVQTYEAAGKRDAYYYLGVRYIASGDLQALPCGAAAVTKGLWRRTGGFPVEASFASDAALISIMLANGMAGDLVPVADAEPLYNYREHGGTDTALHGGWHGPAPDGLMVGIRGVLTATWKPPQWGRYE